MKGTRDRQEEAARKKEARILNGYQGGGCNAKEEVRAPFSEGVGGKKK